MSDSDSAFVVKKPKKQAKAKGNAKKRERTPSEYDPEDEPYLDDGGEDDDEDEGVDEDEEEFAPKKKQKGGSKKGTPTKKAKTGGSASAGSSSSPGGKPVWTAKMKRELFSAMLGQPTKANCTEVAVKLGKEPSQCYDQWRRVLLPAIYKKIDEMG